MRRDGILSLRFTSSARITICKHCWRHSGFAYALTADDTRDTPTRALLGRLAKHYREANIENRFLIFEFNESWENFSNVIGEVFKGKIVSEEWNSQSN